MIGTKKVKLNINRKKIMSIRSKLLAAIAATCIVLLTINGVMIIENVRKDSNNTMSELMLAESGKVSEEAAAFFEKYITVAEVVATNQTIQEQV